MSPLASRAGTYLKTLYEKYHSDAAPLLGAAIAYAALFSLFPLVLLGVSIIGYVIASPERQLEVIEFATNALPMELGNTISDNITVLVGGRGITGVLATVGLIFAALGVFRSLEWALNRIFEAETPRNALKATFLHLGLAMVLFALFLLSTVSAAAGPILAKISESIGVQEQIASGAVTLYTQGVAFTVSVLLFVVVLRFVPHVDLRLREIWIAAVGAALTWEIAKLLFSLFLQNLARFNVIYGSVGAVIAVMAWIYVSSMILLLTAEIIAVNRKRRSKDD